MKELTDKERYALADRLFGILGADLDESEQEAINLAIEIISPIYAAEIQRREMDVAYFFSNASAEDIQELDEWGKRHFPPKKEEKK